MNELNKGYEFTTAQIAELESLRAENELFKQIEANLAELHNVALAEIQSLKTELEAARKDAIGAVNKCDALLELIKDDSYAISFQSMAQYRNALIASVKKKVDVK